jgi:structural maintenance of chromosome 3 (chondroitin sulfate proteoglycan 6)
VDELFNVITERLQELEQEKKELLDYQEFDKDKRCLEYVIYNRELQEANKQLAKLERDKKDQLKQFEHQKHDHQVHQDRLEGTLLRIKEKEEERDLHAMDIQLLKEELEEVRKKTTELTMQQEGNQSLQARREELRKQMDRIKMEVAKKEGELNRLVPEFEQAVAQERSVENNLRRIHVEYQALRDKEGRSAEFKTKARRDEWLHSEMKDIQRVLGEHTQRKADLEAEKKRLDKRHKDIKKSMDTAHLNMERGKAEMLENDNKLEASRKAYSDKTDQRKHVHIYVYDLYRALWREDAKRTTQLASLHEEMLKCERALYATADRVTTLGRAVNWVEHDARHPVH